MAEFLSNLQMNSPRFMSLLEKLISVSEFLQNSPAQGLNPQEDLASNFVLEALEPYLKENGGVLEIQRIAFVEGRGNVIIRYPAVNRTPETGVVSFVGSHFDVVPATPATWERNPFKLTVEGDLLHGRGTTDCLGHIAMLTDLLISLAENKVALKHDLVMVFIANEENGTFSGVGVDQLAIEGYLDDLKRGPLFWIDAADGEPCIGTAGACQWELKAKGKLFHSGLPHRGINAIEFANDATRYCQRRFFQDFPRHPKEEEYKFTTQSTFKATQISCSAGTLNQIPADCTVQGDIRLSPFYDMQEVCAKIASYVAEINANPSLVEDPEFRGPHSKYVLYENGEVIEKGDIALKWLVHGENGVACKLDSKGFHALTEATRTVLGDCKPYSIGGSLPLIRDLQDQGFDVQISGYGLSARYHADNEYASLTSLQNATRIISNVIAILERSAA
jgi:acetylornithine deacetylase